MGHAGTLPMHATGNADAKMAKLKDYGVVIATSAQLVGETMSELLAKRAA
jgi:succinyl-CoA synthetase alpha subunit